MVEPWLPLGPKKFRISGAIAGRESQELDNIKTKGIESKVAIVVACESIRGLDTLNSRPRHVRQAKTRQVTLTHQAGVDGQTGAKTRYKMVRARLRLHDDFV